MGAHMMNPFGGFLPGLDPAMMSYMGFGGLPGFLPGMGMPFGLPPGFMPGASKEKLSVPHKRKLIAENKENISQIQKKIRLENIVN